MNSICASGKWIAISLVLAFAGCGSNYRTVPVAGQILFEGKPLNGGGTVRFIPLGEGPESGKPAIGKVTPTGEFVLTTYQPEDGAIIGEHRVEIVQNKIISEAEYAGEKDAQRLVKRPEYLPKSDRIPDVYSGSNSPLRIVVEQRSDSTIVNLTRNGV